MNYNDKTKEELIAELKKLRQNYEALRVNYDIDIAQHKQTEEIYRKMVDNSPRGTHFYTLNSEKELIFVGANPAADKILKIDNSQFIGKTIGEAFPPLLQTEVPDRYREAAEKGITWSTEQITYNDGKIVGVFEVKAFQTASGSMIAIFDDITQRKQSEHLLKEKSEKIKAQNKEYLKINEELNRINEELHIEKLKTEESEKQLQLIANNFVNGMLYQVAVVDENKRQFNYVSDAVEKLYGCSADEAKKNPDLIYGKIHPDDIEDLIQKEKEALKNMSVFKTEARVINPDGSIRWSYYISRPRIIKGIVCWDGIEVDISERKILEFELTKAKEHAEESELQFRQLFESAADAIFIADEENGIILDVNHTAEQLMQMPKNKIIGLHQSKLHPQKGEKFSKDTFLQHKLMKDKTGLSTLIENIVVRFDGTEVPVEILASKVIYKGKKCLVGTFRDITERKLGDEALKNSEYRFKTLSSIATEGLMIHENGIVLDANLAFAKLIGIENPEEMIGKNAFEITPLTPESKQIVKDHMIQNLSETYDVTLMDKNGSLIQAQTRAAEIIYKDRKARLVYMIDISDRKKDELELLKAKELAEESEMKFSKLFHISPEPQTVTSLEDGSFIMANDAFLTNTGFSRDEIINHTSIDINAWLSVNDRQRWVDELKKTGKVRSLEMPFRTKSFGIREYLVSSDLIELEGQKCSINVYLDITERKHMEDELTKAKEKAEESDRLKTAFLQNMSHEIRTPMNAIMGFSALLVENHDNKPKLEQFSNIINQRCSDLLEIINDILDISKIESDQLALNIEECNVNDLFAELNLFYKEHQKRIGKQHINFNLQYQNDRSLSVIKTDKVKLKQILINLIGNAFKFTENGSIDCGCKMENNKLIFHVSDTGIGIPKDKHDKIFDRFAQLYHPKAKHYGGTGLGLSIAKGLTELLGGKIWLESEPENLSTGKKGGTTFNFSINYIKSDTLLIEPTIDKDIQEYNFVNKTILIVEDDFYNAEYLKEIFAQTDINIRYTEYGKEAIQIATNQKIDLILMDIRLPDLNGYEATRIIIQSKPKIKIIAQTAYAAQDERQKAIEAGCIDYISKPTKRELLIALVGKYLTVS